MKKINLMALFIGAALFSGAGATSLLAGEGMKCGAGKCGASMSQTKSDKCGGSDKKTLPSSKCGDSKAMPKGACCNENKTKAPEKSNCGTGKCS